VEFVGEDEEQELEKTIVNHFATARPNCELWQPRIHENGPCGAEGEEKARYPQGLRGTVDTFIVSCSAGQVKAKVPYWSVSAILVGLSALLSILWHTFRLKVHLARGTFVVALMSLFCSQRRRFSDVPAIRGAPTGTESRIAT